MQFDELRKWEFPESSPDNSLDPKILGLLFSTINTLTISRPQIIPA